MDRNDVRPGTRITADLLMDCMASGCGERRNSGRPGLGSTNRSISLKHPHLLLIVIITLSFPLYADTLHHKKESVTEGVTAFLSSDRGIGNVVQISGSESSLIVDASSPSGARSILEQIQRSNSPPIRYLVVVSQHVVQSFGRTRLMGGCRHRLP